ncbi:FAD-dependent oxidoreductase [Chloroflexota bacterium]
MTQHGFFFDQSRCTGCLTCAVACKNWHGLPPGSLKYLKVYEYEKGVFSDVRLHYQWIPCYHCEEPVCVNACPFDSIKKEDKYGAVLIDSEKCVGCRMCYDACPYGAPAFTSDKVCKVFGDSRQAAAPCTEGCPVRVNVPQYIACIREGQPGEAVAVLREKLPFPSICGRVCFHICETGCNRLKIDDDPVSVRALKRYATDHDNGEWKKRVIKSPPTGKKVAVIGSGPAGLTTAYYLVRKGHEVSVFEALSEAGGMMRVGIPEYRLPKKILDAEIKEIENAGVKIQLNSKVDFIDSLFGQGFDAVFLAMGAHCGAQLRVAGEDIGGVMDGVSFLRDVCLGKKLKIGEKVVVVGGGNVAIDVARTALRLGSKNVNLVCLESQSEMPAFNEEVKAAEEEGVTLNCSWGVESIRGNGQVDGVECKECIAVFDDKGKFNPAYNNDVKAYFAADTVILAIGQLPDIPAGFNIKIGRGNTVVVNDQLTTDHIGVFAGGDVVGGPASVLEAIASGRKAACSIDKYLGGTGVIDEILTRPIEEEVHLNENDIARKRVHLKQLNLSERIMDFAEVELPMTDKMAIEEARRCFECDPNKAHKCNMCFDRLENGDMPICVLACQSRALDFDTIAELHKKYGNNRYLEDMPDDEITKPVLVVKPHKPKKQLIPYDSNKALELMMKRDNLPPIFKSPKDAIDINTTVVGRSKLILKHKSMSELERLTRNDEG